MPRIVSNVLPFAVMVALLMVTSALPLLVPKEPSHSISQFSMVTNAPDIAYSPKSFPERTSLPSPVMLVRVFSVLRAEKPLAAIILVPVTRMVNPSIFDLIASSSPDALITTSSR